jgi:UDPglucose 6-dehydrogenase
MNIGFIGLGKLGLPCASEIATKNHTVYGYDVEYRSGGLINICSSIEEVVQKSKIIFIAVPTPHHPDYDGSTPSMHLEPKDFDYSIVKECLTEVNSVAKGQLVVLISTVLPGTTREQFVPLMSNARFVYNPYLIAMGTVGWDMVNPEMVMIGTEDGSTTGDAKELINFYKTIMENNPKYFVGTWDECECIKVFYNTFISTKIGFVNMIQDVAMKQGNINVDVVTNALCSAGTRIINSSYMTAGMGDGGACHPRDNIALRYLSQKLGLGYDMFESVMKSREIQAKNLAEYLVTLSNQHNLPIVIHGKSYKPRVKHLDGSYSLLIGHYCKEFGKAVSYVDPGTRDVYTSDKPAIFLLAHSATTTYKYWDAPESDELYCEIPEGSVVVDPWRKFKSKNLKVIHYGNTRQN